jgi:hypothetical protein
MGELKKAVQGLFSLRNPTLGVALPLIAYIYLRFFNPAADPRLAFPAHHFHIVSITSLIALVVAIVVGIAGLRLRNLQVLYVALAFISLAAIFSVHGLATPGFILDQNSVVSVAAELAVMTMSFWLLVSSLPSSHPVSAWLGRRAAILLILYVPLIILLGAWALNSPMIVDWIPVNQAPLIYISTAITLGFAGLAWYRYWRSYRYSNFPFQLAAAYTAGWIAVSQFIITTGQTFYLSWWIYHILLLLCVIVCVWGLLVQYRRHESLVLSVQGLFTDSAEDQLEAGISDAVRNLIAATERRDPYTAGHQYRVALGAFKLGRLLNLTPEQLRVLAQGGVVHDIGKLEVPDEILNKPGPLSEQERRAIEAHTVTGYELCAGLGFMGEELSVIRSHHERIDGKGYPDRLSGEQIPILARIMAVSDVWDALTSARAYRPAWPQEEALEYMMQNRGTQFEPRLVNLWVELIRSEDGKK